MIKSSIDRRCPSSTPRQRVNRRPSTTTVIYRQRPSSSLQVINQTTTVGVRHLRFGSPSINVRHLPTTTVKQDYRTTKVPILLSKTTGLQKSPFFSTGQRKFLFFSTKLQKSPSSQQDYRDGSRNSPRGGGHCGGRKITVCEFYFIFGELKTSTKQ